MMHFSKDDQWTKPVYLWSNYFPVLSNDLFFILQLDQQQLNNTRKAKKEILFFNRVPKVGSQTTMELLKQLSVKNNYHYHKDKTQKVERIKLTYSKEVSKYFIKQFKFK